MIMDYHNPFLNDFNYYIKYKDGTDGRQKLNNYK